MPSHSCPGVRRLSSGLLRPGTRVHGPCRGTGVSFGFQDKLWSGEGGSRFASDAVVPVETDFGQTDFGHRYPTDFGQTDFGQTDFGQNRLWPKPSLANPSLAKPTLAKIKVLDV